MDFKGPEHVYRCTPDVLGNRGDEKPVVIHIKRLSQDQIEKALIEENDVHSTFNAGEAMTKVGQMVTERVREKFVKAENLTIDGEKVESFEDFNKLAPPELVQWVFKSIYSTYILDEAELGN